MATHTIAVAGKGGVGKTTTCGMIIDYLCKQKKGPILVVDADANSNLNEVLGVEVETTLGDIREEMAQAEKNGTVPPSMTKADYAEMKFSSAWAISSRISPSVVSISTPRTSLRFEFASASTTRIGPFFCLHR